MTIKLIATDMDGTFLDEKGAYDRQRFDRLLKEMQARGIHFVAASGNSMPRLNRIFEGFEKEVTFVAENGARLVEKGETILHQTMPRAEVTALQDYYSDKLVEYRAVVSGLNQSYRLKEARFDYRPGLIEPKEYEVFISQIAPVDDFSQIPADEPISKVTMMIPEDHERIATDFNQHVSGNLVAVGSGYGAIDFIQKGIHKAWGLRQLMDRYGLRPDQVMTFGDGGNDIEMLQLTPHSYAVANASGPVQAAARHLIGHHKGGAVMATLEKWLGLD